MVKYSDFRSLLRQIHSVDQNCLRMCLKQKFRLPPNFTRSFIAFLIDPRHPDARLDALAGTVTRCRALLSFGIYYGSI